jgi:hypothetical protein
MASTGFELAGNIVARIIEKRRTPITASREKERT